MQFQGMAQAAAAAPGAPAPDMKKRWVDGEVVAIPEKEPSTLQQEEGSRVLDRKMMQALEKVVGLKVQMAFPYVASAMFLEYSQKGTDDVKGEGGREDPITEREEKQQSAF